MFSCYKTINHTHALNFSEFIFWAGSWLCPTTCYWIASPSLCIFFWFWYYLNMFYEWKTWRTSMISICEPSSMGHSLEEIFQIPFVLNPLEIEASADSALHCHLPSPDWVYWCLISMFSLTENPGFILKSFEGGLVYPSSSSSRVTSTVFIHRGSVNVFIEFN